MVRRSRIARPSALLCALAVWAAPGRAQEAGRADDERPAADLPALTGPVTLDGRLDDPAWDGIAVLDAFRQVDPSPGAPARAATRVRVASGPDGVYVAARLTHPPGTERRRGEGLRRDFSYVNSDVFGIVLDGFGDGRFAMAFLTNPDGVQRDMLVFDGRDVDAAWNGVWEVRTAADMDGWTVEARIPWATLRYGGGGSWRANFIREARGIQETSAWSPWQRGLQPWDMTSAGRLDGLDPPPPGVNAQVVPYAVSNTESEGGGFGNYATTTGEVGVDVKWAVSPATVVDLTYNMDFAQAEVDRQVVNLERFSVFFPEQRTFFLESQGLFDTGLDVISPFYSRRIGLDDSGAPVPVTGGARVTHRSSRQSAGALVVRQEGSDGSDGTVFGVGRYVRNVGQTGRIGGIVATRHDDGAGPGASAWNTVGAVDFFARPTRTMITRAMVSRSVTDGPGGDGWAAHAWIGNNATWGYMGWLQEYIGGGWEPRSGFAFARDVIVTSPAFNLDLRPSWLPGAVRSLSPGATAYLFHRASSGEFFSGTVRVSPLEARFQNGSRFWVAATPEWQRLSTAFRPIPGLEIAQGRYEFTRWEAAYEHDPSAPLRGSARFQTGAFYDGRLHTSVVSGTVALTPRVVALASWERNAFRGVGGSDRTTHLVVPELRLAASPRLELSGIWQYNTAADRSALNLRLTWEFRPLSFLYVVYNDAQYVEGLTDPFPTRRRLIVKATWLWQP